MDWFLSFATVAINYIIGKKIKWGFVLMAIMGLVWIYYAIFYLHPAQYGLVPASVLNMIIGVKSFIEWHNAEVKAYKWFLEEKAKLEKEHIIPAEKEPQHATND